MSQFVEYFKQAELALASYAQNLISGDPSEFELKKAELSANQARTFAETYHVVAQHNDVTGLSVTVFSDKVSGETFLAIRGTEEGDLRDLLTDLINITWLGDTTLQPQYISLKLKVAEWIENGILPQSFTVTGHSLGGFLAAGLVAEPVFADHISHAYYSTLRVWVVLQAPMQQLMRF